MTWLNRVLDRDRADASIRSIVVGMHEALPDSLSNSHSMGASPQGLLSGRCVYKSLAKAQKQDHKNVYVLASHSHFYMDNIFDSDFWRKSGELILPGWIVGTAGADKLLGTAGKDVIFGLGGNDEIHGLGGDDLILGGDGDDQLWGDDGNDTICGGNGRDLIGGGNGNDELAGGAGDDDISGGAGDDHLDGGAGNDRLDGGAGRPYHRRNVFIDEARLRARHSELHGPGYSKILIGEDEIERWPEHIELIASSIAAKSWPIVASVSSPMFEIRKVVPLILP